MNYFYILVFISIFSNAQTNYIQKHAKLYEKPDVKSEELGLILQGSRIEYLSKSNKNWIKISVDSINVGYIFEDLVGENYPQTQEKTPESIVDGNDGFYGSAHLFIIGASIKGRKLPDINSKVDKIYTMGEAVSFDFLPNNAESWVNLGGIQKSFIKRKYLGKLPSLDDLIEKINQTDQNDISTRRTLIERAVELSWNVNENKITTLNLFLNLAKELKDEKLIENTELQLILVKGQEKHLSYEEIEKLQTEVIINGFRVPKDGYISLIQVQKFEKPLKITNSTLECGEYIGDKDYHFPFGILSVSKSEKKAEIIEMNFQNEENSIIVKNFKIIKGTSEREFLEKLATIINGNGLHPNEYNLQNSDAGSIIFTFKNGEIFKIKYIWYC